jgi:hypothetical protein
MTTLIRISKLICIAALLLWIVPSMLLVAIEPGDVGVRQSSLSGVGGEDLRPGWHWRIPGVHKVIVLPSTYEFLDYTSDDAGPETSLQIRTKDNNIVQLDMTVPVRILDGRANDLVRNGNHARDADGRYRFQRLAEETTVSVLREHLAELDSVGFYATDQRLAVAEVTLAVLNKSLAELHLEAESVLIRAVRFRDVYESQLQQIQLNEQNKLLDQSRQRVAAQQQQLDNFQQGTNAQAAAREQEWIKRQADLERAYQVGFIDVEDSTVPGAVRRKLGSLDDAARLELRTAAAQVFDIASPEQVSEEYLLGIKNIEAETREYSQRVSVEAKAIAARLSAEGEARVARVRGEFEAKLNALLNSPAGGAYVAWKSAEYVKFDKTLTFSSKDGIPSVLQLRRFAQQFMGGR